MEEVRCSTKDGFARLSVARLAIYHRVKYIAVYQTAVRR